MQEHGRLLARQALEAHAGLDHELDPGRLQPVSQFVPLVPGQDNAEMRHRYIMPVNRVAVPGTTGSGSIIHDVGDELVPEEIEVHPSLITATFTTPQQVPVEGA